jgi:1-acyl-sn-glycerol-3-phosphate acyltransferase
MLYWIFRVIFLVIFKLFFQLRIEGRENIPNKGNFIVVANHTSFLDPLVLGVAIPKKIHWVATQKIYNLPWLKWFMRDVSNALPTGSASEKAINLLFQNKNIGLFPEGTRSSDGRLKEFRRGAALLAFRTGRFILPCALFGTGKALAKGKKFPKFLPLKVKIGKPIYLPKEFSEVIDDIYLQEGTFKIRETIRQMLNEER